MILILLSIAQYCLAFIVWALYSVVFWRIALSKNSGGADLAFALFWTFGIPIVYWMVTL